MKILPSEPTDDMVQGGLDAVCAVITEPVVKVTYSNLAFIYRAMASAYVFDEAAAVERVARAMHDEWDGIAYSWSEKDENYKERFRGLARAAIRALMEGE